MSHRTYSAAACLAVGLIFLAPLGALAAPPAATQPIAVQAAPIEMSYVPESAILGVLVHPARILTSPEFESAPIEVIQATGLEEFGIDPLDISQVLFLAVLVEVDYGNRTEPLPLPAAIIRLAQPYSLEETLAARHPSWEQEELDGKLMLRQDNWDETCYTMPDDTTLLIGDYDALEAIVAQGTAPDSKLVEFLTAAGDQHDAVAVLDLDPIRPFLAEIEEEMPPDLPRPLARLIEVPTLMQAAQATLNLTGDRPSTLELIGNDDADAEEIETILTEALSFGRQFLLASMEEEMPQNGDPVELATLAYVERVSGILIEEFQPQRDGDRLALTYQPRPGDQEALVNSAGMSLAMATPAIFAARAAARRSMSANNMRYLRMAMLNRESSGLDFTGIGGTEEAEDGLSWRVHILPYIEERELYEQFHLDEPWDSEHNRALAQQMPSLYESPAARGDEPGHTHYQLVVGEGTVFDGTNGPRADESFSVMVVEADTTVLWTQPEDWEYDPEDPLHDLGHLHGVEGFNAGFVDGHVEFLRLDENPDMLQMIFAPRADR